MKINVKGHVFEAVVRTENGEDVGYGDARRLLESLGVPIITGEDGSLLVGLRAIAEAARMPIHYEPIENTVYLSAMPLPNESVGANVDPWLPVRAPISGGPGDRRPELLEQIIRQFYVGLNPRYTPNRQGHGETYCNIFVWDVTTALGAEIPHWVKATGEPSEPPYGWELDANGTIMWLRMHGCHSYGWKRCNGTTAMERANMGLPAVATWYTPNGIGHVAIVRPGYRHPKKGIPIAQAGAQRFDDGYLIDGFDSHAWQVEYFVHD